jgi:hypothetical protein
MIGSWGHEPGQVDTNQGIKTRTKKGIERAVCFPAADLRWQFGVVKVVRLVIWEKKSFKHAIAKPLIGDSFIQLHLEPD